MTSEQQHKYNHAEAFCLMWYQCQSCRHVERIWNSRDGITPFALGCPKCERPEMHHVNWQLDNCQPDYTPHPGQYFWRDGTPEEAAEIIRARIDRLVGTEYEVKPEDRADWIQDCLDGKCGEFPPGWPKLDRVPERPKVKVLVVQGTVGMKSADLLKKLAAQSDVCLSIHEEERTESATSPQHEAIQILSATSYRQQEHVHIADTPGGKRRNKLKGRNRRKW